MVCIFCLVDKPTEAFTEEHVFPDAIGGTLVIRTVCKPCNDYLGHSIDTHLTNHWFVQGQRLLLRIKGKASSVPNPFGQGIFADDPSQKLVYRLDTEGNPESVYVVPNISKEKLGNGQERVSMRIDESDRTKIPQMVNKMRARSRLPPLSKEDEQKILTAEARSVHHPWMNIDVEIDIKEYQRGILKIAYELACYWLGPTYLSDPSAGLLRNCIMDKTKGVDWATKYPIRGRVDITDEQPTFPFWQREAHSHIGFIAPGSGDLTCYVRIFQVFEGLVCVSTEGSRYPRFRGGFIAIDPVAGVNRQSSFVDEINRLGKEAG